MAEKSAHVVRPQRGYLNGTACEVLSQKPAGNADPVPARLVRQAAHIAQVFVVAAQFLRDGICGFHLRPRAQRGPTRPGVVHGGLLK